jgi:hypothetical protein
MWVAVATARLWHGAGADSGKAPPGVTDSTGVRHEYFVGYILTHLSLLSGGRELAVAGCSARQDRFASLIFLTPPGEKGG